jgi:hypothetical protein
MGAGYWVLGIGYWRLEDWEIGLANPYQSLNLIISLIPIRKLGDKLVFYSGLGILAKLIFPRRNLCPGRAI